MDNKKLRIMNLNKKVFYLNDLLKKKDQQIVRLKNTAGNRERELERIKYEMDKQRELLKQCNEDSSYVFTVLEKIIALNLKLQETVLHNMTLINSSQFPPV